MKGQNKTPEKELKLETSNRPDAEFETLAVGMFSEARGRAERLGENSSKEIKTVAMATENEKARDSSERKTTGTGTQAASGGTHRSEEAEGRISELKGKAAKNSAATRKKSRKTELRGEVNPKRPTPRHSIVQG